MRGVLAPRSTQTFASTPLLINFNQKISHRQHLPRRALTVSLFSSNKSPILKQAVLGIASAAALAGAAFLLVRNSTRQQRRHVHTRQQQDSNRNNSDSTASTSAFYSLEQQQNQQHYQYQQQYNRNSKPRWMQLGWKSSTDAELQAQLALIEAKRAREAAHELDSWDRRWKLRKKTLAELRQMAAKMKINGRAKMRKPELVAALEQRLGLAADSSIEFEL